MAKVLAVKDSKKKGAATSPPTHIWWVCLQGRMHAREVFIELPSADRIRLDRSMLSLLHGVTPPDSLFKLRKGKHGIFEFKSGKHRVLACYVDLLDATSGYVLLHTCQKAGGQNDDIRPEDEQAAISRKEYCLKALAVENLVVHKKS